MRATKTFWLLLLLAVFAMGSLAQAQSMKIGFVKDERIKAEYRSWTRAQEQWEMENKSWEEEATTKQQELLDLEDDFERKKLILSEDKKREQELAISTKREALDAFTKQIYGPGGTAERKYEQLVAPLLDNVTQAIEAVSIEENYDVVFTLQSGLGYIKEQYDITDKVLQKLDEIE